MKKETMLLNFPRTKELAFLKQRPLAAESPREKVMKLAVDARRISQWKRQPVCLWTK
jgi:hypothetical protein